MVNMIINLLRSHEDDDFYSQDTNDNRFNDMIVFHHTTDDSRNEVIPRYQAALASEIYRNATINLCNSPHLYKDMGTKNLFMAAYNKANSILENWAKTGRLIIKDVNVGKSLTMAEMTISCLKEKFPNRNLLYVCDNLYKIEDPSFSHATSDVEKSRMRASAVKELSVRNDITTFATVEYNKSGLEGGSSSRLKLNEMISMSKALEYDANFIAHLMNEMHTNPDNTNMYFWSPMTPPEERSMDNREPIIDLIISKNKIAEYKGEIFYYLLANRAKFIEICNSDLSSLNQEARAIIEKKIKVRGPLRDMSSLYHYYGEKMSWETSAYEQDENIVEGY